MGEFFHGPTVWGWLQGDSSALHLLCTLFLLLGQLHLRSSGCRSQKAGSPALEGFRVACLSGSSGCSSLCCTLEGGSLSPGLFQSFLAGPGGGLRTGERELPLCRDLSGLYCHTSTKSLAEFFFFFFLPASLPSFLRAFLSFSALGKTLLAVHMWSGGCGKILDLLGCPAVISSVMGSRKVVILSSCYC